MATRGRIHSATIAKDILFDHLVDTQRVQEPLKYQ
jgi:hypothetical protein